MNSQPSNVCQSSKNEHKTRVFTISYKITAPEIVVAMDVFYFVFDEIVN